MFLINAIKFIIAIADIGYLRLPRIQTLSIFEEIQEVNQRRFCYLKTTALLSH